MREWTGVDAPATYIQDPVTGGDAISRIDEDALRLVADELGIAYEHRTVPGPFVEALRDVRAGTGRATGGAVPVRQDRSWMLALPLLALVLWEVAGVAGGLAGSTSVAGLWRADRGRPR